MDEQSCSPAHPKRYLSPQEFSQLSGLSLATVHRYLHKGKLRHLQPAGSRGRILIPIDALENPTSNGAKQLAETAGKASGEPPVTSKRLAGPRPLWTRHGVTEPTKEN
jgi:excisionase family DNA binding protein